MFNVKSIINDLSFDNDRFEKLVRNVDPKNPHHIEWLLNDSDFQECGADLSPFQAALDAHNALEVGVSKDDMKAVFIKLKERVENPRGTFDKHGRFYLRDSELTDVRAPSTKYPYSQMQAGRTAKHIKALAEKYKCQTLAELEAVAFAD